MHQKVHKISTDARLSTKNHKKEADEWFLDDAR